MEGLTLLVADDDPDIRLYVRQCVMGAGGLVQRVIEAADGERALEVVRSERPDVVVCDVVMPRLGGFELCERLRADPATADIPILIVTGGTEPEATTRRVERAGAQGVLFKPFNARRLRAAIEHVLDGRADPGRPPEVTSPDAGDADRKRENQKEGEES